VDLFLFRHGPSEARDPVRWPRDDDRPLSEKGTDETATAARGLARLDPEIRRVVSSPARRADATAALVREALGVARAVDHWEELAPDAPAGPLLARVASEGRRAQGAVLVGHEPVLSELVGLALTGEAVSVVHFSRAGAARVAFDRSAVPGAGALDWLLTRRQLCALAP